jgi:Helix-turn-helix domain of resolvase
MGRPSKLTEQQWEQLHKRLLAGEKAAALAREFGVSPAVISNRFSKRIETVKAVANQVVAAEQEFRKLNVNEQLQALTLMDDLRAISTHLAGAAKYGAASAHRLAGIANAKVQEIDDAAPLDEKSLESLRGVAALTKIANECSVIGRDLLAANKDMIKDAQAGKNDDPAKFLAELAEHLPD